MSHLKTATRLACSLNKQAGARRSRLDKQISKLPPYWWRPFSNCWLAALQIYLTSDDGIAGVSRTLICRVVSSRDRHVRVNAEQSRDADRRHDDVDVAGAVALVVARVGCQAANRHFELQAAQVTPVAVSNSASGP